MEFNEDLNQENMGGTCTTVALNVKTRMQSVSIYLKAYIFKSIYICMSLYKYYKEAQSCSKACA